MVASPSIGEEVLVSADGHVGECCPDLVSDFGWVGGGAFGELDGDAQLMAPGGCLHDRRGNGLVVVHAAPLIPVPVTGGKYAALALNSRVVDFVCLPPSGFKR